MNRTAQAVLLVAFALAAVAGSGRFSPGATAQPIKIAPGSGDDLRAAYASATDIAEGKRVAEGSCASCHGLNGISAAPGVPHLAGQRPAYLHFELRAYKSGTRGDNAMGGWVGEVMGINSAGNIAVGLYAGKLLKDAYMWTSSEGVTSLGRYPVTVCYFDWWIYQEVCDDPETVAFSVSDDGKVITGAVRLPAAGIDEAAIYTPKMGWMLLTKFLERQGVLEASRWLLLGANVSAQGKTLAGTAIPLAADYYHGFRLEIDQVYVCQGKGKTAKTLRVGFPDAMDQFLARGATVGLCPGDAPL